MDFSQSYYPGQFLDDTAPLLDLDPSLLPEDEFDLSDMDNGSPLAGSPDLTAGADGNALATNGLAAAYLGANGPAFSLGTGVPALDNNSPSSSSSAAFNAPPLQLGPTPQSGPSETLPPWAEYLAPELRHLFAAAPHPQQWEDTPVGAYTNLPSPDDWLQAGAADPGALAGTVTDGAAALLDGDGSQTSTPGTPSDRVDLGEVSMGIPVSKPALPPRSLPSVPTNSTEPPASGGSAFASPDAAWPWGESPDGVPLDPYGEPIIPTDDSGNSPLKIITVGGRQMIETPSGFVPFEDLISTPPPGEAVPVNLDAVRERMRRFAFQNELAAQPQPQSLGEMLAAARQRAAEASSRTQGPQLSRLESAGDAFVQSALGAGVTIPQALQKLDELIAEQSPEWLDPRTRGVRQRFYAGLQQRIAQSFPEDPRYQGELLAHSLPSLVGGLAPLVASGVAGRALGMGEVLGALPTAATLSLQEAQGEYERAIAAGASESTARRAFGFGAGLGAVSGLGLGGIGGAEMDAPLESGLVRNGVANFLREANAGGTAMAYNRLGELADAHGITGYDHTAADPAQVAAEVAKAYGQGALLNAMFHAFGVKHEQSMGEPQWQDLRETLPPVTSSAYENAPWQLPAPMANMVRSGPGSIDVGAVPPPPEALVEAMEKLRMEALTDSLRRAAGEAENADTTDSHTIPENDDETPPRLQTQPAPAGSESPKRRKKKKPFDVHARLKSHVAAAIAEFELKGYTDAQERSLRSHPELSEAHRGTQIDTFFKRRVNADKLLKHLVITPRFTFGPDVFDPVTQEWWDVTTPGQWQTHLNKYWLFGKANPLFTR